MGQGLDGFLGQLRENRHSVVSFLDLSTWGLMGLSKCATAQVNRKLMNPTVAALIALLIACLP